MESMCDALGIDDKDVVVEVLKHITVFEVDAENRIPRYISRSETYKGSVRMIWENRCSSLNEHEFVKRYKVTKEKFAEMVKLISPMIKARGQGGAGGPISTELKLSMTLRFLAGGHVFDIMDLHGVLSTSSAYSHIKDTIFALDAVLKFPDITDDRIVLTTIFMSSYCIHSHRVT